MLGRARVARMTPLHQSPAIAVRVAVYRGLYRRELAALYLVLLLYRPLRLAPLAPPRVLTAWPAVAVQAEAESTAPLPVSWATHNRSQQAARSAAEATGPALLTGEVAAAQHADKHRPSRSSRDPPPPSRVDSDLVTEDAAVADSAGTPRSRVEGQSDHAASPTRTSVLGQVEAPEELFTSSPPTPWFPVWQKSGMRLVPSQLRRSANPRRGSLWPLQATRTGELS